MPITDVWMIVRLFDGLVVSATVGEPSTALLAMLYDWPVEAVPAVEGVAIGWYRQPDGTYAPPPEPEPEPEPEVA